jgi:hypothetical protein
MINMVTYNVIWQRDILDFFLCFIKYFAHIQNAGLDKISHTSVSFTCHHYSLAHYIHSQ